MKTLVRESSVVAYDTLKTGPLARQERMTMSAVRFLVSTGAHIEGLVSRRQIAHATGLETSTVAARRLVEDEQLRPCPITGRNVHQVGLPAPEGRVAA